jgi:hypothetical protein
MAEAGPDRSSIEIKSLLRKLHPDKGNHKDRIRRLGKFRNYVMGDGVRNTVCKSKDTRQLQLRIEPLDRSYSTCAVYMEGSLTPFFLCHLSQ